MREALAVTLFGLVLALTIGAQISDSLRKSISRRPILNIVPSWRFFGPVPAIMDMHLLIRAQSSGCEPGSWQEIPIPPQGRWRALWNPSRLEDKAVHDLANGLSAGSHYLRERISDPARLLQVVQVSQPYMALLSWVMDYAGEPTVSESRQFALIGATGGDGSEPSVIFISRFHMTG